MSAWSAHLRNRMLAGLFFLLPSVVTGWLLVFLFGAADRAFTRHALRLLGREQPATPATVWLSRLVAAAAVFGVLYAVGVLATNVVGQRLLQGADAGLQKLPGFGAIYRPFRQALDAFGPGGGTAFRRCVLVEYPRAGVYRLGFVTNERVQPIGNPPRPCIAVFVPMSPYPASGFLVLVPVEDCRRLGISVEEGLKMVVSGGIVMPDRLADAGQEERR